MKFLTLFLAAAALVVAAAQNSAAPPVPADLTSVVYITTTIDPVPSASGTAVTECATNALCGTAPPPSRVDVYPGTTTVTLPTGVTETLNVTQIVTQVVVTVTSVAVATRGICPTETTSIHASNKTVVVMETHTQFKYEVHTITTQTPSVLTVSYTADNACTIKTVFPVPQVPEIPTSPGSPPRSVTAMGGPEVTAAPAADEADQQPMGVPPASDADEA